MTHEAAEFVETREQQMDMTSDLRATTSAPFAMHTSLSGFSAARACPG